ncbi:MAG: hypothetical protein GY778_16645 [bacterium]|nr:hypothetical protein [bacterium]
MKWFSPCCCLLLAAMAAADELEPLVEAALDQPVKLNLQDTPLAEAFETVAQETGVVVTVDPATFDLLPYGADTKVNARMQNIALRQGLIHLAAPLGLRFEVRDRGIDILPTAALTRIGRRATWDELDALAWLTGLDFMANGSAAEQLAKRIQFRVGDVDGWPPLQRAVQRVGAGPGGQVLTLATDSLDWTWYPQGNRIVVLTKTAQIKRQLDGVVSIRQSHRKLIDVVQSVGRQVHLTVRADPGAVASLPIQTRDNFSLHAENKTAREALEAVAASSGLGYRVEPDGVVFFHPGQAGATPTASAKPGASRARSADPYVGKISVTGPDGVVIELLLHESDLSDETNRLREKYLEQADEIIRLALLDWQAAHRP